ncbi:hypothetical protein LJR231_000156 [Phyllobacterium sp. LjRoot231]|uniref:hypothetical protein n=1 Tax=Phyllobacterium sp. LjRoot231 TaxID=3342289 RepID=UPI003ECFA1C8
MVVSDDEETSRVTGVNAEDSHLRDLDCGSVFSMFPHLLFDPEREPEETPQ